MKLGEVTVVVEHTVDDWDNPTPYGPGKKTSWTELEFCAFNPTRSTEDQSRSAPAILGAQLLAPEDTGSLIEAADSILYPWQRINGDPVTYTGRRWELVGEVGDWGECAEAQLRRLE